MRRREDLPHRVGVATIPPVAILKISNHDENDKKISYIKLFNPRHRRNPLFTAVAQKLKKSGS
jgi:hypothetical protein